MQFVSWATLGLTVDLRGTHLQQGQWYALLWWHLSFIKDTLLAWRYLLAPSSPHPGDTVPLQQHHPAPFPSAAAFSLQVPAGLTVVLWLIGRTAHQVQRAAVISCGRGVRGKLAASFC